jgi:GntR family transcriptional regulator, transcriptional repressor for pyruvate dehydrogenase complex
MTPVTSAHLMNLKVPTMKPIKRRNLVDDVIRELENGLFNGQFPPGSRLPSEPELMQMLGVGRSTLREAVRILGHQGVLEVRQGDGTYVRALPGTNEPLRQRLSRASILEVYEARRGIEVEISRLAAVRRTEQDIEAIRAALMKRNNAFGAEDWGTYVEADVEFHHAIAQACRSSVLIDIFHAFTSVLTEGLRRLVDDPVMRYDEDTGPFHEDLLRAIESRDSDAAIHATIQNLDSTIERLQQLLQE